MNIRLQMMATLWENTYRVIITGEKDEYVATVRAIVNIPLDPTMLPENAPTVDPQLLVLVEDFVFEAKDIIPFETSLAALLQERFKYQIPHVFFYYPSPEDVLQKS